MDRDDEDGQRLRQNTQFARLFTLFHSLSSLSLSILRHGRRRIYSVRALASRCPSFFVDVDYEIGFSFLHFGFGLRVFISGSLLISPSLLGPASTPSPRLFCAGKEEEG